MKKSYFAPELDIVKFSFENLLDDNLIHSKQQGYAEGGGGTDDGDPFGG